MKYTKDKANQHGAILRWFKERKTLTTGEAAYELGILCLHKRIAELREDGYVISTDQVPFKNRWGHPGSMARHTYWGHGEVEDLAGRRAQEQRARIATTTEVA